MTGEQFDKIVQDVRSGTPLDQAVRRAGVHSVDFEREIRENPQLEEVLDDSMVSARNKQKAARTYDDDPALNDGDAPPEPKAKKSSSKRKGNEEKKAPPWERIADEAREMGEGRYGYFLWLNEKCAAYGMHKISDWWKSMLGDFYASGKRCAIVRAGRGSGKSTSLVRMASSEAIFTDRVVPPGQNWIWPFVSVNATDAGRRIPEIVAILNCLGIEHKLHRSVGKQSVDMLDKNGQQVSFLSLACNISALSGPTAIGGTIDEEAKLLDKSTNANPATEVLASMIQTFRGQDVRMVRCSSAWDLTGSHALAIQAGDTSQNFVARIGERFLPIVINGLRDVADYIAQSGDAAGAKKVLDYAATVDGNSPNVPTWLANPTRDAVGCYRDNEALPRDPKEGKKASLVDIFLRENASHPLTSGGVTVDVTQGIGDYAARNRQLCAPKASSHDLIRFDGLPSWDPRSRSYGGGSRKPTL